MSELNPSAEDLVKNVRFTIQRSNVIPMPIDPTLSIEGEAADAKATGDAIAGVIGNLRVNTKAPVNNAITVYAGDIRMTDEAGSPTIAEAIGGAEGRDASSIMYDTDELITVKDALDDLYTSLETDVSEIYDEIASEVDGINATLDSELTEEQIDEIFEEVFGGDD